MKFIIEELIFLKGLLMASTQRGYSFQELKLLRGLSASLDGLVSSIAKPEDCPFTKDEKDKPKNKKKYDAWVEQVQTYLKIEMSMDLNDEQKQFIVARFVNFNGFSSDPKSIDLIFKMAEKLGV